MYIVITATLAKENKELEPSEKQSTMPVIPPKTGIQKKFNSILDSCLRRNDEKMNHD